MVTNEKVLKKFEIPIMGDEEEVRIEGISKCVVEFGRLLDDASKSLMHFSLKGLHYSLNSDLTFLQKKDTFQLSDISSSEMEDEIIRIFQSRIDKLNQELGD